MKTLQDFYYSMLAKLTLLRDDQRGQTLVEYALIIVVIALVVVAAMKLLQGGISDTYTNAANTLKSP